MFEHMQVDLGAIARDSKVFKQAAIAAATQARQEQRQKCKASTD
jgi:hypothetical protein